MIKGKILKITENTVYVGYEDGSLKEIPIESCDFEPIMGDYVEIYGDIAIKAEGSNESSNESSPVKKSVLKEISLVSKANIFLFTVIYLLVFVVLLYDGGGIQEATIISLFPVSVIMIVLNLIFIIISSIKKNKINKKSSITCFIIAILCFILSIAGYVYMDNTNVMSSLSGNIPNELLEDVDMKKNHYVKLLSYDKWNKDELPRYSKLQINAKVFQVIEDKKANGTLIQVSFEEFGSGYGNPISVFIPKKYLTTTIEKDDKLVLYGRTDGVRTYSVNGERVTRPFMVAYMYDKDN